MQYVEQQLAEFKAEFAKRRRRQLLAAIPIVAIIVLRVVLDKEAEASFLGQSGGLVIGGALVVILGTIAFSLWNWRCPACNKYLGKGISPAFCAKCGVALR
jgi:hypothetical protein